MSNMVEQGELKRALRMLDPKSKGALEIDEGVANAMTSKFSQIRQELFEGINPINSKNLNNFLI